MAFAFWIELLTSLGPLPSNLHELYLHSITTGRNCTTFLEEAMKRLLLLTFSLVLIVFGIGCGSGKMANNTTNASSSSVMLSMGDASNDRIIAFSLTVNSIVLTGGSNPTVLSTPTTIEFVHNAGTFQPLVQADVPS